MSYSVEQAYEAIKLAEKIALRERRGAMLKDLKAPSEVLANESVVLNEAIADLMVNELAEKLLPQARAILEMRLAREKCIQTTILGELHSATIDILSEGELDPQRGKFADSEDRQCWINFCNAITEGNHLKIIEFVHVFSDQAIHALIHTNLPPFAVKYIIPE